MTASKPIRTARAQSATATNSLGGIPSTAQRQMADRLRIELQGAADTQQSASDVMQQLHGLFEAIRKLGGQETLQLACVGAGIALDWADILSTSAESAFARCHETKGDSTSAPIPAQTATAPIATLSMAAYDTATLHLEKAETLAEMFCVLGPSGLGELTPSGIAGAFAALQGELFEIREALVQDRKRGEA